MTILLKYIEVVFERDQESRGKEEEGAVSGGDSPEVEKKRGRKEVMEDKEAATSRDGTISAMGRRREAPEILVKDARQEWDEPQKPGVTVQQRGDFCLSKRETGMR